MTTPRADPARPSGDATDPPQAPDGGPGGWPRWPRWLVMLNLAVLAAAIVVPTWLSSADEAAGRVCLVWLAPLFAGVIAVSHALQGFAIGGVPVAAGLAVLLYVVARFVPWLNGGVARASRWVRLAPYAEAAALWTLTLAVAAYRFYALNRILPDNIGEMTFSVIAASDWHTMLEVNAGALNAPWAPLGLFYFMLEGALLPFTGSTLLTMRIAAAVMSVLVTQILYFLVRLMGGPLAAIIAAVWYAASPVEMVWARHDMFPFNSASPIVLGLAITTYLAVTRFRTGYWVATALLMGATYHLFASGFSGFLVPIGVLIWLALFDRQRLRRCGWNVLWVAAGLFLWTVGRSLVEWSAYGTWEWLNPYDPRLGSRVLRGGGWGAWKELWANVTYVVDRLYVGLPDDVHQTPIGIFGMPRVYIDGLVAIFFSVGMVWAFFNRRQPAAAVLLALFAASLLPGITSIAAAHRMAVAFPAISALAALVAAGGLRRVQARLWTVGAVLKVALPLVVLTAMFLRIGGAYFERPLAEPPHMTVFKAVRPFLTPGTIAVVDLPVGMSIDVVYQMFDQLRTEPLSFVMLEEHPWTEPIEPPVPQLTHLFYRETALKHRVTELAGMHWTRAVYFLHDAIDGQRKLALLQARFPNAKVTVVRTPTWRPGYDFTAVEVPLDS